MALEENAMVNPMVMPVSPMGGGYGNGGLGGGDGWAWIVLLLLLVGGRGWGNGNGGDGTPGGLYPWMNQSDNMNAGFQNVVTQLCNGFAGVVAAINGGFANAETAANARQVANMQQMFAVQTSMNQGFNTGLAQSTQNTRDIIEATNARSQAIMDKLCALELDGVKAQYAQAQREIASLQNQLSMAALRESQTAQNAFIQQGFTNEIDALYNRLQNCPVGTVPVYGSQPIFTCNNNGLACGCNA